MSYSISKLFEEHYIKDRDQKIVDQITKYLSNNHEAMLDGFFKTFVIKHPDTYFYLFSPFRRWVTYKIDT